MTYIYMLIYYSKIYWSVLGSILTPWGCGQTHPGVVLTRSHPCRVLSSVGVRHQRHSEAHSRSPWCHAPCHVNIIQERSQYATNDAFYWTYGATASTCACVCVCVSVPQKVRLHWLIIVTLTQQTAAIYKKRSTQLLSLSGVHLKS